MMTRVLVTGASGFIGANAALELVKRGCEVHTTVRQSGGPRQLAIGDSWRAHEVDLVDATAVRKLFESIQPDTVLHLAGPSPHHPRDASSRASVLTYATVGALAIIESANQVGVEHLIVGGSSTVYPYVKRGRFLREIDAYAPATFRGVAKTSEELVFLNRDVGDVPVSIARLFNVYGPWEAPRRLIPTLFRSALRGDPVRITRGKVGHDFVFVEDVVDGLLHIMGRTPATGREVVNLGTGRSTGNRELVSLVAEVTGYDVRVSDERYPASDFSPEWWAADTDRMASVHNWSPRFDLRAGLEATWRWYNEAPDYWNGIQS